MIQAGIFSKTFSRPTLQEVLAAVQAQGLEAVHLNCQSAGMAALPESVSEEQLQAMARDLQSAKVNTVGISATFNMLHPDKQVVAQGEASFQVICQIAHTLGIPLVTVCTGSRNTEDQWAPHPENQTPASWAAMLEVFGRILPVAQAYDIYLGVEPELGNVVDTPAKARQLFRDLASDRIRFILDPANLFETLDHPGTLREVVAESVDMLADALGMVHVKDRAPAGEIVPAGEGAVDFPHFFGCLKQAGFAGPAIIHGLPESAVPRVVEKVKQWLEGLSTQ
jgi:sugar phosphate isomerase/epimerase